jgi:hypothetical protein
VLALNVHGGFECRHSGACCTAGWPIPVEAAAVDAIRAHGLAGRWALGAAGGRPDGAAAVLEPLPDGACPALDQAAGNLCAIQRRLGHDALPAACRHFPRVALLEADAVRVTLSHFCPTAARMLARPDVGALAIVGDAAGIADRGEHEGFDARRTIPPFLRPGVAMDAATCRRWERAALGALDAADTSVEDRLAALALMAEAIRAWTPESGTLQDHAAHAISAAAGPGRPSRSWRMPFASASHLFRLAVDSIPRGLARPAIPDRAESADLTWAMPRWASVSRPLGRYLAARSFGSWSAYLGEGLRTQAAMLAIALAAVRVEAARETGRVAHPLDEPLLLAAIRSADMLLHHLSDTAALVRSLAHVEQGNAPSFLDALGLEAGA